VFVFKENNKQELFLDRLLLKTSHPTRGAMSYEQEQSWFMGRRGSARFAELSKVRAK